MGEASQLQKVYNQTKYKLANHGVRNIQVLQKAFEKKNGELESDLYGTGQIIEDFQSKMASYLGKEDAVFFPSGTMAQQIALRIWCDEKGDKKVAYHPLSHLEIHEEDGLKELHHIETVLLADRNRVIDLSDVMNMENGVAAVLLELPQREIGGQLPSFETLRDISKYCRENNIRLHLDGARLLEVLPYYGKTAAEVCAMFDSVYVSLYKGIGGIAGAILAGAQDFINQSKVWKRRYGGDLISLYPYIISADYYFDMRAHKMEQYFRESKEVADQFNSCYGISTLPAVPVSNMFHVHIEFSKEQVEPILLEVERQTGIGLTSHLKEINKQSCYFEVHMGDMYSEIPKELVTRAFDLLNQQMKRDLSNEADYE
ncbi:aminotransferase class I/II-fold pyridoxal phosphate-dependent enzyme [Jeotgalibacillus sp. ET6]|uniref:threonine aldolase family protein n=1 Tax=Jeotgalibacillus sp. ET6 TaxID=3037260 RepID=UPI0024185BF2|nr:aminotransferase class I/II-fold pyridoxal phosphate-dependent enzyme [Jeotgalibacillus sp. ET6]MDG5472056.1 aminotransferase class I/II-fold pyridoxal phosphate-dependent enzyme [Jeotgalibacillus sp. ET6]